MYATQLYAPLESWNECDALEQINPQCLNLGARVIGFAPEISGKYLAALSVFLAPEKENFIDEHNLGRFIGWSNRILDNLKFVGENITKDPIEEYNYACRDTNNPIRVKLGKGRVSELIFREFLTTSSDFEIVSPHLVKTLGIDFDNPDNEEKRGIGTIQEDYSRVIYLRPYPSAEIASLVAEYELTIVRFANEGRFLVCPELEEMRDNINDSSELLKYITSIGENAFFENAMRSEKSLGCLSGEARERVQLRAMLMEQYEMINSDDRKKVFSRLYGFKF